MAQRVGSGRSAGLILACTACLIWASSAPGLRADEGAAKPEGAVPAAVTGHEDGHEDHSHADHSAGAEHAGDHGHGHESTIHGEAPKHYFGDKTKFLYWSPQLFIWTLLLFLPLWFLLHRLVWVPMIKGWEERESKLADSLSMAAKLRDEAKSLLAEQDADVIRAQQEAKSLLDQAREETNQRVSEMIAQAKDQVAEEQKRARAALESAARQGMEEIDRQAGQIGQEIAVSLARSGGSR